MILVEKKYFIKTLQVIFLLLVIINTKVQTVFALGPIAPDPDQGCEFGGAPGLTQDVLSLGCLTQVVVNVIEVLLLFLGSVSILFIFYAAIRFIIARGDPKAIQNAQKTLTYAVLGTILIVLAYAIISIFTSSFGLPLILQNFGIYQGP